ncbi:TIM44 subunit of mitochondria import inner membrane translocase [Piedraia hortae CBS 480.64]|uniref:Mitochondrial import inner membrane translocase subunit TIM44 n=1 Tax=Piedraia hortae CBS 480.64 TaxID=1314780 RepID=A0A6A7BXQ6_9PEZI|nr:TIM44 subunit of mitochondria import inner membrane translocase [Piedraia hortae CBS 480.64]
MTSAFIATLPRGLHGRTAAYRRLASGARRPPFVSPPFQSVRGVSFKELREERARQRASEPAGDKPAQPQTQEQPRQRPQETQTHQEEHGTDEADEIFARIKAESEQHWREEQTSEERTQADNGRKAKEGEPEVSPYGNKSPLQVFQDVLRAEFEKSKEWEESTKKLSGSVHTFTSNPNVQRARSAYSHAIETASAATGKAFTGTADAVGRAAARTWETPVVKGIRQGANAMGEGIEKATRPVRETEAYRDVQKTIDDGSSQRYGGWVEREERRRLREARDSKARKAVVADPDAGTSVQPHRDAAWKESWNEFRTNSPLMQRLDGLKSVYRESDNALISTARSISDRVSGWFGESETARVIRKFREMDAGFQLEPFLNDMRSYILPEVLEAYVKGDLDTLKLWLSPAQFQVYQALAAQFDEAGLRSDGRIVDIRGVDLLSARILTPGDIPVFVVTCRTQEVHVYRKGKTGELAAGMEDRIQQVTYAIGVTRVPEEVNDEETGGWKFIELHKSGRDYI